jgi:glycosyltransferase involved in cell wall biosynthesis
VKFLTKYIQEQQINKIISTGPPHSMHMIALGVKQNLPQIKWIADFRDPWTQIDFYNQLKLTRLADYLHKKMEKKVLKNADVIVTVSPGFAEGLSIISNREIQLIHNGYDPSDFNNNVALDRDFSISYFGSMNKDRNFPKFWKALANISIKFPEFSRHLIVNLIGEIDKEIFTEIEKNNLSDKIFHKNKLPHKEVVEMMCSSQVLLLTINNTPAQKGIMPGKMYEYFGSKRPIIALGMEGSDAKEAIQSTGAGKYINSENDQEIEECIVEYYHLYLQKNLYTNSNGFEKFSRRNLASCYAELLNSLS